MCCCAARTRSPPIKNTQKQNKKTTPNHVETDGWHVDVRAVRNPLAAGGVDGVKERVGATADLRPTDDDGGATPHTYNEGHHNSSGGASSDSPPLSPADATDAKNRPSREDRARDPASDVSGGFQSNKTYTTSWAANYSVAHFERVVTEANAELLGCNSGWSRYLDWHLGVWCVRCAASCWTVPSRQIGAPSQSRVGVWPLGRLSARRARPWSLDERSRPTRARPSVVEIACVPSGCETRAIPDATT